jgi:hypothetical protein
LHSWLISSSYRPYYPDSSLACAQQALEPAETLGYEVGRFWLYAKKAFAKIKEDQRLNNHQLLAGLNGEWTFKGRRIPTDTTQKPIETFGTITRKGIWENRYFTTETSSGKKIPMPWANCKEMTYHDMYMEGCDNAKKKFFFLTVGNHWSTGYMSCEGSYDSTTSTLTYEGELELAQGTTVKILRIIKFVDPYHYNEEWHRSIGGKKVQRSEGSYTRIKSK